MSTTVNNLYSKRAEQRRKQFNRIINGCNMVLMNNIPEVDESIWENFDGKSPMDNCDVIGVNNASDEVRKLAETDATYYCQEHDLYTDETDRCDYQGEGAEVYQWFAVGDSDADFLKRHDQYITYSDLLDTYFLAITHFGTSWDYVDSMVDAFSDCYTGLDEYSDNKE